MSSAEKENELNVESRASASTITTKSEIRSFFRRARVSPELTFLSDDLPAVVLNGLRVHTLYGRRPSDRTI